MAKKVIIHIGTEKTGTTTLQSFLALNRKTLGESGILVPRSLGEKNHRLLAGIVNHDEYVDDLFRQMNLLDIDARRAAKRRWWEAFCTEVRGADLPRAIISSEHLQSRLLDESEVVSLRDHLAELFDEMRVCLYIREPAATAVSLYSTAVKHGGTTGKLPGPEVPYFRNVIDHAATLRRWSRVFGRENITVRLFDRSLFPSGDLIDDFMTICDIPATAAQRPTRENESLSALGIELLRRINSAIPAYVRETGTFNEGRKGLADFFEFHFSQGARYVPTAEMVNAYQMAFKESNEWVRKNFFPDRAELFSEPSLPMTPHPCFDEDALWQIATAMTEIWKQARSNPPKSRAVD